MGDVAALTWPLTRPGGPLYDPSNRVRRCLFGPVDHEKAELHLEKHMDKVMQQNKLRWNFDFENDRPLPNGRYVWKKVGDDADPPDPDSNGSPVVEESSAEEEKSTKKEQTHITDFMRKRKSSNQKDSVTLRPKSRRRSST